MDHLAAALAVTNVLAFIAMRWMWIKRYKDGYSDGVEGK